MKGQQTFDAMGHRWTIFLGNAAQCALEEAFDKGFFAIVADAIPLEGVTPEMLGDRVKMAELARRIRVSSLRDIAWHGMVRQHPDLQLEDVSDLIDDIGQQAFGEIVGKAIAATQDHGAKEAGGDAAPGKPPKRSIRAKKPTGSG